MARTVVGKEINAYIRNHDLKDRENDNIINPDEKLRKLLNIKNGEEVNYFNLQKYMKHHFIEPVV
jgi:chromatin remodeling complex protein RSC6